MSLQSTLLASLPVALWACAVPAEAQTSLTPVSNANTSAVSVTLSATTPTLVLKAPSTLFPRVYERLINVGNAGVAWCSRSSPNPAPNAAGSFPLAPFGNALGEPTVEEFQGGSFLPQQPLWCIADSTGSATLTGEVSP